MVRQGQGEKQVVSHFDTQDNGLTKIIERVQNVGSVSLKSIVVTKNILCLELRFPTNSKASA